MIQMHASVSSLETYRQYRDQESISLDDVLRRLRKVQEPTETMAMGKAFHKFLETCVTGEHAAAQADGYIFLFEQEFEIRLPALREMRCTHVHTTGEYALTVHGVVDAIDAGTIYDHKLTGYMDLERYTESYQWRLYLWMLGHKKFIYNIFVRREPIDNVVTIHDCQVLSQYRYPALDAEVRDLLDDYVKFTLEFTPERAA